MPEIAHRFSGKYSGLFKFFYKSSFLSDCQQLQEYWLCDWPDNPRLIASKLVWFEKLRNALKIDQEYKPDPENNNLSIEANRLRELINKLFKNEKNLKGVFTSDFIDPLQITQFVNQKPIDFSGELLNQKQHIKPSLLYRERFNRQDCELLREFIQVATKAAIPVEEWRNTYERAFWQTLLEVGFQEVPVLAGFNSITHERSISKFKDLDHQSSKLATYQVAIKLYHRRPRIVSEMRNAGSAEIALLMKEFKKQRIKPLRRLFSQSPNAILEIKPCLMMSPLTISQYLDPQVFKFDLVIFDEASQIRMEDALGAIFRAKQVIVVGDEQQLPPTRFFDAWDSGDDYDEEDEISDAVDYESILTRAEGEPRAFRPVRLRWHYRSLHEELIAFSNKRFYDNYLFTFPNPEQNGNKAVSFVHVQDGIYDRGRSRTNIVEARKVASSCFDFARQHPNWSLGVVTFSEAQKQIIKDEVDRLLLQAPELAEFFAEDRENGEPFTVKNLELIQGDERDSIFFSFGYGKDQTGAFTQNFGPLNQNAGRRRLNVAVTRARRSVCLFSSVLPEDLTSDTLGVQLMKEYMTLARDGLSALYGNPTTGESIGETESLFEEAVASRLRKEGLEVHSQIGCSGYRIDLGIVDPVLPGRYVLGVECDGASYHSGKTVRDRDRLRQEVLESLGWNIMRVWSRSWNENPNKEIQKILNAVRLFKGRKISNELEIHNDNYQGRHTVDETNQPESFPILSIRDKYPQKFSKLRYSIRRFQGGSTTIISQGIAALVTEQGPSQWEQLVKQVCTLWGYMRVGDNIRISIEDGIRRAAKDGLVIIFGDPKFVYPKFSAPITIRVSDSEDQRKADEIPLEEFHLALWLVVAESGGSMEIQDAMKVAASLLGFQMLTNALSSRMMEAISISRLISQYAYGNVESPLAIEGDRIKLVVSHRE